jgi:ABC-type polysaccharide/polyol phosphate export permease
MTTSTEALASPRPRVKKRGPIFLVRTGFGEMLGRRRLTRYLVGAELKRTHADTAFGQIWWILDPLLQMSVYFLLFAVMLNTQIPDYPLFLFAAILPWKWFSTTMNEATLSVVGHQSLIRQIQFPKVVLPTASVVAGTISFGFGLIALGLVYLFYLDRLSVWVVCLPLIGAVQFVLTLGLGILFSAANAFFRDVQNVMTHALRLLFYLSGALIPLDRIATSHPSLYAILSLNPFAILFKNYRAVTYGTSAPDWAALGVVLAFSLVLLLLSIYVFKRVESAFARIL